MGQLWGSLGGGQGTAGLCVACFHSPWGLVHLQVVDMRDLRTYYMKQDDFFEAFKAGGDQLRLGGCNRAQPAAMLKVKDFPPTAHFAEVLPRHWQVNNRLS